MKEEGDSYKTAFFVLVLIIILGGVGVLAYFFGKGEFFVFEKVAQEMPSPKVFQFISTPIVSSPPPVASDENAIKQAVYKKLDKDESEILVTINKNTGTYATGGIKDVGSEVGGGYFRIWFPNVWMHQVIRLSVDNSLPPR